MKTPFKPTIKIVSTYNTKVLSGPGPAFPMKTAVHTYPLVFNLEVLIAITKSIGTFLVNKATNPAYIVGAVSCGRVCKNCMGVCWLTDISYSKDKSLAKILDGMTWNTLCPWSKYGYPILQQTIELLKNR